MKLSEIKKAEASIESFCKDLDSVISITNQKGVFMARVTRKSVQIFLITGESLLDCIINASNKCEEKRSKLGV